MIYSSEDLANAFGTLYPEAEELIDRLAPFRPDIREGGRMITAMMRGLSGSPTYRLFIRVQNPEGASAPEFYGECSCPTRRNCVHVVAALTRALELETVPEEPAARVLSHHPPTETTDRCIVYTLELPPSGDLVLRVQIALKVEGGLEDLRDYRPRLFPQGDVPGYVDAVDQRLFAALVERPAYSAVYPSFRLDDEKAATLLHEVLATERCLGPGGKALRAGESRLTAFNWRVDRNSVQYPDFGLDSATAIRMLGEQIWYLDTEAGMCGPLDLDIPPALLPVLGRWSKVAADQAGEAQLELDQAAPDAEIPRLRQFHCFNLAGIPPTPWLTLTRLPYADEALDLALVSFGYAGYRLSDDETTTVSEGESLVVIERDRLAEAQWLSELAAVGLGRRDSNAIEGHAYVYSLPTPRAWHLFQIRDLPQLQAQGWEMEIDSGFGAILHAGGEVGARLKRSDQEWFDLGLTLEMDGEKVDLLPILLTILRESPRRFSDEALKARAASDEVMILELPEGRGVALPLERMRRLFEVLFELYEGETPPELHDGEIRFDRFRALRLADLAEEESSETPFLRGEAILETLQGLQRLREVGAIPEVRPPAGLQAELREYQQHGLNWLQFLRELNLGGILADDMGLGKTVQLLTHLLLEKEQGRADLPSLAILPTSLLTNWRREAARFAPDLRVLVLHGAERHEDFDAIPNHDLVLTTYSLVARDFDELDRFNYHLLVLDEAQWVKNPAAKSSRSVRALSARHRLCVTGTPMENHLGELWSLFDFVLPGYLGESGQFKRVFRTPIEQEGDEKATERLNRRIRPFLLRRTKELVAPELPPKIEMLRSVELTGAQRDLYESIRVSVHNKVREEVEAKGLARSSIVVLDALLKLRQVCCDPRLVKLDEAQGVQQSAKLEMLMELLPEMIEEGRGILLFSQFTEMLDLIEVAVREAEIPYVKLTGETRNRALQFDRFERREAPLFLISLKAGGVGLNLTAADTVIHYDPWWNPAVERQATARAHRVGQHKPVFVYRMIAEGTVEEKIIALQQRKKGLAEAMLRGAEDELAPMWEESDLELLFQPLE